MSTQKKEHDCEFFLVTDVTVYACECDPHHILIDNKEYVAVDKVSKARILTESEQADKIIDEMGKCIGTYQTGLTRRIAKHCSVVAVNAIISQNNYSNEYWANVKKEILKDK